MACNVDKKNKKLQKQMTSEKALQSDMAITAASEVTDLMALFPAFEYYNRNALSLRLSFWHSKDVSPERMAWTFDLCKTNMQAFIQQSFLKRLWKAAFPTRAMHYAVKGLQDLYTASWGWSDRKKRQELRHSNARFIIAEKCPDSGEREGHPVAYAHFRFEQENGEPVLYLYEIQLDAGCQGRGLGKFMMRFVELIAFKLGMRCVMLTVMEANTAALKMYSSLGYIKHPSCPESSLGDSAQYLILHKPQKRART